jgi:hypothetical protein
VYGFVRHSEPEFKVTMSQSTQPRKAAPLRAANRYDEGNRRAAEIILRDPQRYAALVEWAQRFLKRTALIDTSTQPRQGAA